MPTPTYTPLATVTLGATASSVTFSSIPATYRDLVLVIQHTSTGSVNFVIRANADTGSNYNQVNMIGLGTSTSSSAAASAVVGASYTTLGNTIIQAMDYSATDKHKTFLSRNNTSTPRNVRAIAVRWSDTSAITSLGVILPELSLNAGSTFSLYGVIA